MKVHESNVDKYIRHTRSLRNSCCSFTSWLSFRSIWDLNMRFCSKASLVLRSNSFFSFSALCFSSNIWKNNTSKILVNKWTEAQGYNKFIQSRTTIHSKSERRLVNDFIRRELKSWFVFYFKKLKNCKLARKIGRSQSRR